MWAIGISICVFSTIISTVFLSCSLGEDTQALLPSRLVNNLASVFPGGKLTLNPCLSGIKHLLHAIQPCKVGDLFGGRIYLPGEARVKAGRVFVLWPLGKWLWIRLCPRPGLPLSVLGLLYLAPLHFAHYSILEMIPCCKLKKHNCQAIVQSKPFFFGKIPSNPPGSHLLSHICCVCLSIS